GQRRLDVDPCLAGRRELVAAERIADDPATRQSGCREAGAKAADNRAESEGPRGGQRFRPWGLGKLGLGGCPFTLHDGMVENAASLRPAQDRIAQEAIPALALPRPAR